LKVSKVVDNVYAIIGPIDDRSYENDGLNNNQAFIVTRDGVILIDSGASRKGAERIEKAIADVTKTPVKWVINTGSQDHRWLGNGHFAARGAEVIAFEGTVATQKKVAAGQMEALAKTLKDRFEGTTPVHATRLLQDSPTPLTLGAESLELRLTNAHFPDDSMVWLPKHKVAVTGDLVYVDRMLGVHDTSSVQSAWEAWQELVKLDPVLIVPGHGEVCDMAKAKRDTGDYYDFLVNVIGKAAQDMEPLDEVIAAHADMPQFKHLKHYDTWHRTIMSRTYLQFEGQ
ncbi:MAG TPA: MBL fold metallo-hydrolase, partial [Chromatiales bacterium]|nr:MBL fold metallo-hydrolase [Chromatiales bacterium]